MLSIKSNTVHSCHISGYQLFFNGRACHIGYFVNVKALREFWNKYRVLIVAGYFQKLDGWYCKK